MLRSKKAKSFGMIDPESKLRYFPVSLEIKGDFMIKFLLSFAFVVAGFSSSALADYASTPQPYPYQPAQPAQPYYPPYYPAQPYPYYGSYVGPVVNYIPVQPYVMCFAQGLANGAWFYGIGPNYYVANQWAMYACNSSGQYCQLTGCRY